MSAGSVTLRFVAPQVAQPQVAGSPRPRCWTLQSELRQAPHAAQRMGALAMTHSSGSAPIGWSTTPTGGSLGSEQLGMAVLVNVADGMSAVTALVLRRCIFTF